MKIPAGVMSPFGLIQELALRGDVLDGWRVLVACVLCNVSRGDRAIHVMQEVFFRWPTPINLAIADRGDVEEMVRPLGLQVVRAIRLISMSECYAGRLNHDGVVRSPIGMPGVGPYAIDAWDLFVDRIVTDLEPDDGILRRYWSWAREQARSCA